MLSAGILSPAFAAAPAAPVKAAAVKAAPSKVTSVEGITEYRLANGLRVLLFPDASKPTVTTNIVYMVGSRHENYGETGMAHLLEHLLFKPTANFGIKKGTKSPVEVLNQIGGTFNGTTSSDRTNYFAVFPANDDNLKQMLAMEADRMVNSPVSQDDLWNTKTQKGEMTVVRNEYERGESEPFRVTIQRNLAVAFDWHNYGKSTIGARSDIEGVNIERLRAFYQRYYQPDNAILMVAGRFDEAKVLAQVNDAFGKIPKPSRVLPPTYTVEPTQDGERSVTIRRTGGMQVVTAGYHVAPAAHADGAALEVLNRILADAPSGRLHKALVDTKLANQVGEIDFKNMEPGYSMYLAVVPKDGKTAAVEEAMLKVLEDLKANPVTDAEVARAKAAIAKNIDLTVNDTTRLTLSLTAYQAAGDWRLFHQRRDQVEKVTAADVQAAAIKYLKSSNRTVARFIPTEGADRTEVPNTPDVAALIKDYKGRAVVAQGEVFDPSPDNIEKRTQRSTLANGMKLALLPKSTKGNTVTATVRLRMGTAEQLMGKDSIGGLTAALLSDGTERLSRQEIKDAFDKIKAAVRISGDAEGVTASVTTTRDNLAQALELVAESLMKPAFTEKDFNERHRAFISGTEQQMAEPGPRANNAMRRLTDTYPVGHVRHVKTFEETLVEEKAVTLADIKSFHKAFYGAGNATMSVVGDFDAAAVKAQAAKLFGSWKAEQPYARIVAAVKPVEAQNVKLETPDKANSVMYMIQPMPMKDDDKAYPAVMMGNFMLGGGALRSRLADRIRQKEGLSYTIGSDLHVPARDAAGMWSAFAISAPQNAGKVEAALREELDKAVKDGFTEAELVDAKKSWLQSEQVGRTSDAGLAGRLASYLSYDRTMAYDKDLEARVAALTVAQVNEAMRTHLKPATVSVVKAGDFAKAAAAAAGAPAPAAKP
jgi:zinc protease